MSELQQEISDYETQSADLQNELLIMKDQLDNMFYRYDLLQFKSKESNMFCIIGNDFNGFCFQKMSIWEQG